MDLTSQTSYVGFGPEWADAANTPFRQHKQTIYEGGANTPFILHWPAGIPAERRGEINRSVGHVIDLLPTFVELAGGDPPSNIEGRSLVPVIETGTRTGSDAHPYIGLQYAGTLGLTMDNMKIISDEGRNWGLFDLSADPAETNDLSADPDHSATLATLESKFDEWATRGGVGVRNFFAGSYDGGADQGDRPVPGDDGAIQLGDVDTNGFDMSIAAASDSETATADLEYASYWSYRGDLETVQDLLTHAEPFNNWAKNRLSFSIPLKSGFLRGTDVYGYVTVRDADDNIAVYGPAAAAAIPFAGTAPGGGEVTRIEPVGQHQVEIEWTAAAGGAGDLRHTVYIAEQPMNNVGEALAHGRPAAPAAESPTSATVTHLTHGLHYFAVVAVDADDNAILLPPADGVGDGSVDVAVGAVSTYGDFVALHGNPPELADPDADANGNGLSNFADYALGNDPLAHRWTAAPLSIASVEPPRVRFPGQPYLRDVRYKLVANPSLDFASDRAIVFDSATDRWEVDPGGAFIATDPETFTDRRFFRLEVESH